MNSNDFSRLARKSEVLIQGYLAEVKGRSAVFRASSYTLGQPGKRLRPVLVFASAELLGLAEERVQSWVLAVECIHNASLIHDDLPALDNDDFRRGEVSCHRQHGEAQAILAGDLLIAEAFRVLAVDKNLSDTESRQLTELLAFTMISLCEGQGMEFDTAAIPGEPHQLQQYVARSQYKKTAALISAALSGPAMLAGIEVADVMAGDTNILERQPFFRLSQFGDQLGLLFQLTDDLLDAADKASISRGENDPRKLKLPSMVELVGPQKVREMCEKSCNQARELLKPFGDRAAFLDQLCCEILERTR